MRRLLLLVLVAGVLATPAAADARSCGSVAYPKGSTAVTAVKGRCAKAVKAARVLFNARDTSRAISFALSGDGTPSDIDVLVSVGNDWAWICPVYVDDEAVDGVTCTQRKTHRRFRASDSVPRRVWASQLDEDTEGGGG